MDTMLRLIRRLLFFIRREQFDNELAEEMAFHRSEAEKQLQSGGMTPESAHYAALRKFGNPTRLKEQSREVVEFQFETALQDFRYALRQLRKSPAFASTAIFVLALGLSSSIAIFAFVDATLIKPLPYSNPSALVDVTEGNAMIPRANLSYADYLDWKRLNTVFRSLDVYTGDGHLLRGTGSTEVVSGERVSDGFFRTLGVSPALGRDLSWRGSACCG